MSLNKAEDARPARGRSRYLLNELAARPEESRNLTAAPGV
jgi:hypothetical protein